MDRLALPAPDHVRADFETAFTAPRTPVEEALCKIWSETLGVTEVGVHDDFFELGGHSLLAVRMLTKVQETTGKKLTVAALFGAPTICELSQLLPSPEPTAETVSVTPAKFPPWVIAFNTGGTKRPFLPHGWFRPVEKSCQSPR